MPCDRNYHLAMGGCWWSGVEEGKRGILCLIHFSLKMHQKSLKRINEVVLKDAARASKVKGHQIISKENKELAQHNRKQAEKIKMQVDVLHKFQASLQAHSMSTAVMLPSSKEQIRPGNTKEWSGTFRGKRPCPAKNGGETFQCRDLTWYFFQS